MRSSHKIALIAKLCIALCIFTSARSVSNTPFTNVPKASQDFTDRRDLANPFGSSWSKRSAESSRDNEGGY